jgi:hypothetical protein
MTLTRTATHNWKGKMATSFRRDGTVISEEAFIYLVSLYSDWTETTERTENGWRDVYSRAA